MLRLQKGRWILTRGSFVAFVLALSGCCSATVNILPKEGGTAQAISTSAKEGCAIEKAQAEADDYCKKLGKTYVAINSESKYQGADPNAKLAIGVLTRGKHSGNTSDDYRVQLDFKCE
jgi:hypothetical protein